MSTTQTSGGQAVAWPPDDFNWGQRRSNAGPWLASIWLIFLLPAVYDGWQHRDTLSGVVGIVSTVAFAVLYTATWMRMRRSRMALLEQPPVSIGLTYVAALVALACIMVWAIGQDGTGAAVFVAVAAIMSLPLRVAIPVVGGVVAALVIGQQLSDWPSQGGVIVGTIAGSFAVLAMRGVISRNIALMRAYDENTGLAVENERNRFARDLHDILGHSLTVITVKAELAQRLIDVDPERARDEVAQLERLSRDALSDVRRAVSGYRGLTLPGELARARAALRAAEIQAHVPHAADDVPSELRELFAWTVREGVTNVIRHSGARHCEIVLTPTSAEIRDDGRGPVASGSPGGSGLTGLRERCSAVGATVVIRSLEPGFSLQVNA